jgi:uncharacterized protein involved in outer membrane biogenesis
LRWRRIAFWSGFGLLALIVFTISWLLLADLGSFKPQIERWASEKTGRQISINGDLQISLARYSSVVAEDIRISNADWAEQADMVSVGRLEVRLDLRSILGGPIVVELIDLDDATIYLTKPEQGDPNWVLLKTSAEDEEEKEEDEKKGILFRKIDIDRVQLTYRSPQRAMPIEIHVEQFSQRHREDDLLDVSLGGTLNGRRMKFDGEVGTWAALLARKDVHFDVDLRLDTFSINADGHIDDLLKPHRPRINFTAKAPDINDLMLALGVAQEGQGVIDLVGSLTPQAQGPLVLVVAGQVGRLEVEASGEFSDLSDFEDVDIDLLASGEDVRSILEALGLPQTRPSPFMINVDAARHGNTFVVERADMVFGEAKFGLSARLPDFPNIDDSIIQLQIDGPDLERFREVFNLPGAATGPFSAGFTIDVADDGFELVNVELQTSLGRFHIDGKIGDAPDYFGTSLNFEVSSHSLAVIASAYGVNRLPDAPIAIRGSADYGPDGIRSRDSLTVTVNEVTAKVDGLIRPVKGLLGSDFEFEVDGPDLAALIGAFSANEGVPAQPYTLDGQLQFRDDGYRFRDVAGKIGTSDVEVDGLLVPRRGITGSQFNFSAKGVAFTEITDQLGEFEVRPGPYELTGSVNFEPDVISFNGIKLNRATGSIDLDFELGLPVSRHWANLDIRASGPNVQSLIKGFDKFEADAAPFRIDIEGKLRDTTWSVEKLDLNVGVANLSGQGTLDLDGDTSLTQFDFSMNVPNVGELGKLDGNRLREDSFTLNAKVTGGGGVLRIDDMLATLGSSDIKGDIEYRRGDTPYLAIDIESDSIVFAPLLEEREPEYDPTPEFDDGRMLPDITIPFEAMAKLNASIEINIGELQRDALHIRDIILHAGLQDGVLELSQAGFQAKSGAVGARGRLDPDGGQGSASLELVARDLALGMTSLNQDLAMTGDVEFNFDSTGNDLRSLFGNANGILFLNTRGGRLVNNRLLRALYGDMLDEILGTINPFSKTETHTDFECIIVPIEFNSGVVTNNSRSLIATDKMRMIVNSEIDLKSESLDVNIRTVPKKGIVISAGEIINPYIKVVGTLASPRLAVDETGVLLSGGVAIATGGLSILARAAWNRMSRAKDACAETAEEGIEELGDRFPELYISITPPQPDARSETEE